MATPLSGRSSAGPRRGTAETEEGGRADEIGPAPSVLVVCPAPLAVTARAKPISHRGGGRPCRPEVVKITEMLTWQRPAGSLE